MARDERLVNVIATNTWTRQRADGTIVSWHQEDEAGVTSRDEAKGMIQRTINFWLPKLVADIQTTRNLPLTKAWNVARQNFRHNLTEMLAQPFPRRWGLKMKDFTFDDPDAVIVQGGTPEI